MNRKIKKLLLVFIMILALGYRAIATENGVEDDSIQVAQNAVIEENQNAVEENAVIEENQNVVNETEVIKSEVPELIEYANLTLDNYYEYNEQLHNNKSQKRTDYNSDATTLSLKEYIFQESRSCPEYIDVSAYQIPFDDARDVFIPFLYYDEMFYIDAISNWKGTYLDYDYTTQTGTAIVSKVYFDYVLTADEIEEGWEIINREIKIYKSGIQAEWSDLEKVLYTNNFLCQRCEYASDIITTSHTLYGALVTKLPVCDGYSHAFRYLLAQIGIDATIATSTSMNHAWNLVKLDGEYYHIDVTWNDSYNNGVKGVGKTSYEFFLASDSSFQTERKSSHYDWVADYSASSTKYDGTQAWRNQNNYLIYKDNYWYYMDGTGSTYTASLYKIDLRENELETSLVKSNTTTSDYIFFAPGFTTDGENLYYSTEYKIYQMDYNGENLVEYYKLADTDKCIYSLEIIDDVFYYDTLDFEKSGNTISASTSTRTTNICEIYTVDEELIYTVLDVITINDDDIIVLSAEENISDLLVSANFPVIDEAYIVEVYNSNDQVKSDTEYAGSNNTIKIMKAYDYSVVKEFIVVVNGDISGDGKVKMYDAFQILKSVLFNESFDEIETLICDYNSDGSVKMYDAFAFLKKALFT